MSNARPVEEPLAETLSSAPFVRVAAASDGDSLAAAGLLARACADTATPFQLRLDAESAAGTEDAVTVAVGPTTVEGDASLDCPASPAAFAVARRLGADPDPLLALAGTIAAGETVRTAEDALDAAEAAGRVDRQPGLALPSDELPADLAASTLLHGPFSGDEDAAAALIAELGSADGDDADAIDAEFGRRLASLATVDAVTAEGATERAAQRIERALRPHVIDAPFATLGGYADVLDAVARVAPTAGIALALGEADEATVETALTAWREYGHAVHDGLRSADTARHRGLWVLDLGDADPAVLPAVARLAREFRSPEPVAIALTEGAAAVAGESGIGDAVVDAAEAVDGTGTGTDTTGTARFDTDTEQFTDAFREAL